MPIVAFTLPACSASPVADTLHVLVPDGAVTPHLIPFFEMEYRAQTGEHINVRLHTYKLHDSLSARTLRDSTCDVLLFTNTMAKQVCDSVGHHAPFLRELAHRQAAPLDFYLPWVLQLDSNNRRHALPYQYTTRGIMYKPQHVLRGEINTWHALWSYALQGHVQLNERTTYEHIDKWCTFMHDTSLYLSLTYSCDALKAMKSFGDAVEYVIPREGSYRIWCSWGIPQNAQNPLAAYAWLRFVTRPKVAKMNMKRTGWSTMLAEAQMEMMADMQADSNFNSQDAAWRQQCMEAAFSLDLSNFNTNNNK